MKDIYSMLADTSILEKRQSIWEIEGTKIKPLLLQDDIIAINITKDIQKTVNIIETFQHLKRLEFHEDKTKKSIFNGKRDEKNEINGSETKRATEHKYLGKIIEEGLKEKKEIQERIKMANIQSNGCRNIINNKYLNKKKNRSWYKSSTINNNTNPNIWSRNMEQTNKERN